MHNGKVRYSGGYARRAFSPPGNVKKIAVLRANAIGDFVFALPALVSLRSAFPKAEIVLLGREWHEAFLKNRRQIIDRVIVLPDIFGIQQQNTGTPLKNLGSFMERLKKEQFDIAIQLHGGGKYSNSFIKRIGARYAVGLKTDESEDLDATIPYIYFQNEYERYLEVVALTGALANDGEPKLEATEEELEEAEDYLQNRPFAVIHPGATDIKRRWSPDGFGVIAGYLSGFFKTVYLVGTENEASLIERVISRAGTNGALRDLSGTLTVTGLSGLISGASMFIGNDSGPLHLADAFHIPTVGLYWCANVITAAPPRRADRRLLISWQVSCPLCGEGVTDTGYPFETIDGCGHGVSFLNQIRTRDVIKEIDALGKLTHTLFSADQNISHRDPFFAMSSE